MSYFVQSLYQIEGADVLPIPPHPSPKSSKIDLEHSLDMAIGRHSTRNLSVLGRLFLHEPTLGKRFLRQRHDVNQCEYRFALPSIVLEHLGAIPLEPDIWMTSYPLAQDRVSQHIPPGIQKVGQSRFEGSLAVFFAPH